MTGKSICEFYYQDDVIALLHTDTCDSSESWLGGNGILSPIYLIYALDLRVYGNVVSLHQSIRRRTTFDGIGTILSRIKSRPRKTRGGATRYDASIAFYAFPSYRRLR